MKIKPLNDRVVVRQLDAEATSAGGIILPGSVAEKPTQGEVVAVGDGLALDDGTVRALTVKVGDRVLYGKYAGNEIKIGDDKLLIMKESDILAIVEESIQQEKAA